MTTRRAVACVLPALLLVGTPATALAAPAPTPTPPALPTPTPFPTSTLGGSGLARPGVLTDLPRGVPAPPPLRAGAYVVADLRDGRVLLAANAHARMRPASTLKALTALTVAPTLAPTTVVEAIPQDAAVDGTKVGLLPGETYTVHQLLQALLLTSGNDAANALGRAAGGVPATARRMTAKAHALGAVDTVARNTSGLDADGQLTSAYDLALIGRAAVADPDVAPYLTTKTAVFPGARVAGPKSKRKTFQIGNHNRLLWNYDGMIGVKNGYTKAANQTYIGAARRGDRAYVITYLGGQGVGWRDTAAVLDWAFAHGDRARPVGTLETARTEEAAPDTHAATATAAGSAPTPGGATPDGRRGLALAGAALAVLTAGGVAGSRLLRRRRG